MGKAGQNYLSLNCHFWVDNYSLVLAQADETLYTLGRRQNLKPSGHLDGKFSVPDPSGPERATATPNHRMDLACRPVLPCNVAQNAPQTDKRPLLSLYHLYKT